MEALQVIFFSIPFLIAVGLAVGIAAFGGAVIGRPIVPLFMYLAVFAIFAQSSYGSIAPRSDPSIYFRGGGWLFFPAVLWALLVMVGWTWMGRLYSAAAPLPATPLLRWLWMWLALLLAHLAWGLFSGYDINEVLGVNGFVLIPWMLPLIVLMMWSARDETTLFWLARALVLTALAKSLFGLGRWAFFGGDEANVYQNFSKINIQLTFFDIGDNLVILLGAAVAMSLLVVQRSARRQRVWDAVYMLTVLLALACITLSFRRTAWLGVALASLLLLWRMNSPARIIVLLGGMPILFSGIVYASAMRLGTKANTSGLAGFLFDLTGSRFGGDTERLLELKLAFEAFVSSPLVGIGSWGRFASGNLISWQEQSTTPGAFVHSGVLLIAMKSGLLGLLLLGGLAWAFISHVRRMPRGLSPEATALVIAGCCGLLFMLPDIVIGTPFRQLRTTQLLAFCLGLPLMVTMALKLKHRGQ